MKGRSIFARAASEPHLAIAPLAFLGAPYASAAVFGFALIPPRGNDPLVDPVFQRAMRAIMPLSEAERDATEWRRRLVLDRYSLAFALGEGLSRRSLDPAPYVGERRVWASCTPIVLDRHLKASGNETRQVEIEGLIRQACVNIGLPEPKRISAGKHSAIAGSPSAYPSGGAPRWTRWKLPESLASRLLIHAVVEFPVTVRGPVILCAGRFVGLGLCRTLDAERRQ